VLAIRFNPDTKQRSLGTLLWGLVPYWSKDDKTGFINARAERIDTAPAFRRPFQEAPMLNSCRRLLRMEENARRQNPLFYRDKRRGPIRFRGPLRWLAKSQYQGVATNLRDHQLCLISNYLRTSPR
jgi:putative SOS response-associated peptidase YedK